MYQLVVVHEARLHWCGNLTLTCEQSLIPSKIRGEERKTNKGTSVTVSATTERRCREPLAAWALEQSLITRDDVVSQLLKFGSAFLSYSWESKINVVVF